MPGSSTTPGRTAARDGATAVLPSTQLTASAPGTVTFAAQWLAYMLPYRRFADTLAGASNGWPTCSPADASPLPSREAMHGSGPTRVATPSSYRTFTNYSLPVSRRTNCSTRLNDRSPFKAAQIA